MSSTVSQVTNLSDRDKQLLMRHIKHLAEVYDGYVNDPCGTSRDYRSCGVNPYNNQTVKGLCLEFRHGSPSEVWTPWGYWHFGAAPSSPIDLVGFMSRLTVREYIIEHNTGKGVVGPVYAILAIDGEELPEPILPSDRRQYLDFKDARAQWTRFFGDN